MRENEVNVPLSLVKSIIDITAKQKVIERIFMVTAGSDVIYVVECRDTIILSEFHIIACNGKSIMEFKEYLKERSTFTEEIMEHKKKKFERILCEIYSDYIENSDNKMFIPEYGQISSKEDISKIF